MKKKIYAFLLVLILCTTIISAQQSTTVKGIIKAIVQEKEEPLIVVGQTNDARDVVAAASIGKSVRPDFINYKLDTEFSPGFTEKYLVIVGGPCANTLWAKYSTFTCENWPYADTKGIMQLKEQNGKTILLIAGSFGDDTESVTKKLLEDYLTDTIYENSETIIKYSEEEKEKVKKGTYLCGNGRCDKGESAFENNDAIEYCPSDCY